MTNKVRQLADGRGEVGGGRRRSQIIRLQESLVLCKSFHPLWLIAPISTFMCLWAIYIVPGSVYIQYFLQQNRHIPIVGLYKSLTDAWMWKLGLSPRYSFSGNICFEISVFCLCSVYITVFPTLWLWTGSSKQIRVTSQWTLLSISAFNFWILPPPPPLPLPPPDIAKAQCVRPLTRP